MQRYRYEADPAEREPLDDPNTFNSSLGRGHPQGQYHSQYEHHPSQSSRHYPSPQLRQQDQQYYEPEPAHQQQYGAYGQRQEPPVAYNNNNNNNHNPSPPRAAVGARRPNAEPDFSARSERRLSRDQQTWAPAAAAQGAHHPHNDSPYSPPNPDPVSPLSSPHLTGRSDNGRYWGQGPGYSRPPAAMQTHPQSNVTPGSDNFSEAAAGGMAGIAYQVAERNARESGLDALGGANPHQPGHTEPAYHGDQLPPQQQSPRNLGAPMAAYGTESSDRDSHSSMAALGAAAFPPGMSTPIRSRTPLRSPQNHPETVYTDDPYSGYSRPSQPSLGVVNPHDIYDDGDDGLEYGRKSHRASMLSLGGTSNRSGKNGGAAAAGAGVAGRAAASSRNGGGYGPVNNLGGGGPNEEVHNLGAEKSWGRSPQKRSKKWRIIIIAVVAIVIVAAIVIGILFGVVYRIGGGGGGSSSGQTAAQDSAQNGDLDRNSTEIKALMNNPKLHKVFMGMDYTPLNTQFPDCEKSPPSQNNVTRDVAVLSQLTNTIRLYGTDCNQTEMVLHAISRLGLNDTVKVWLGVWQDYNGTTNERQLSQMWNILDTYGAKPFKGLIVANEILFRKEMSSTQLQSLLTDVRNKLAQKNINLPVATSDLGTDWTDASLVKASDYIMANIHPFFGGQPSKGAADWTLSFWKNNIGVYEKPVKEQNVVAEIGWPSQGGQRCPPDAPTNCATPAVASISDLNQILNDWVCPALNNGTNYFWFSAFDEPWKIRFDTEKENWEDHWGLMDVNRNLKPGVTIPDCGGKTVP